MWDQKEYIKIKEEVTYMLDTLSISPVSFMQAYKTAIVNNVYEAAKAITECLAPLNYHTADTHMHLKCLN